MSRSPAAVFAAAIAAFVFAAVALAAGFALAANPIAATTKLPEGYALPVRIDDAISTRNAAEGDHFTITLAEALTLPDGTVLPEGYRGMGEVTRVVAPSGFGRVGRLSLRLDYIRVGDAYIRLRAVKVEEGHGNTTNMVLAGTVAGLFGMLAVQGHSARIVQGQVVQAVVDKDVQLPTPIPPPPQWN